MGMETTEALTITCDNPDCPGNELDPHDRKGWLFISSEYYAVGTVSQHVFCCADCAGIAAQNVDADFANEPAHPMGPMTPISPQPAPEAPITVEPS